MYCGGSDVPTCTQLILRCNNKQNTAKKNACLQYHPPKLSGQRTRCQSSMTKYSHNMRLVNPLCAVNQRFWLLTQAAMTAWVYSCSLVYISRSGTHGFSSATRLSNVATSRQLCTHEQIQSHHSTSLLKQRYKKPLFQSIPFHDIFFHHLISPCSIQGIHWLTILSLWINN